MTDPILDRPLGISDALYSLRPTAKWIVHNDDIQKIEWLDEQQTKPADEEILAELERLKIQAPLDECKNQAKKLLADTDWVMLSDVNISNRSEFESYRTILRNIVTNPVANPVWPAKPEAVWV
jgi:hypothetical protein